MPVTKSPLRYPGGKTQLSEFLKNLLQINEMQNIVYCEPFSGGFGAGMELLFSNEVDSIIINDLDLGIYSIWNAILNDNKQFIKMIRDIPITIEEWHIQKEIYTNLINSHQYSIELGFATFFLNRTNRSGIISGGPIGGYNQESAYKLDCRFNKEGLIEKIRDIYNEKARIKLYNLEANDLINNVLLNENPKNLFIFFDPPYYKQGKNLYKNFFDHDNHIELRKCIDMMSHYKWITTYDYEENIKNIYRSYPALRYKIRYSANRVRKETEYLFHSSVTKIESFDKVEFQ
ncbi:DNA adenine methylase [Jeotgalibaca sp. MA1X17-3]|uniref:DNA adenine methylase n=1 Tax=Jeotgalibaca sp. MA1X17-3 TaxID=2908211 RepID=UPI001F44E3C6|nr:DNA adenine methylase [Jeotgalibaca sp. MA1X17-3]UJF14688.1 DNA adenine methylase [Jeotgalibaca sp. MA1X17-3]